MKAIKSGFDNSKIKVSNLPPQYERKHELHSSIFVHEVSKSIHQSCFNQIGELKVVGVNKTGSKTSGEWLLDSCIVNIEDGFIQKIYFALESESSTGKKEFDEDFAKVLHINSAYRLYLNGLNHKTESGLKKYIQNRLSYAERLLNNKPVDNLYIGFWPSTEQEDKDKPSFWKLFEKYPHLDNARIQIISATVMDWRGGEASC